MTSLRSRHKRVVFHTERKEESAGPTRGIMNLKKKLAALFSIVKSSVLMWIIYAPPTPTVRVPWNRSLIFSVSGQSRVNSLYAYSSSTYIPKCYMLLERLGRLNHISALVSQVVDKRHRSLKTKYTIGT